MFVLTLMRDNVRTHPADFRKPRLNALLDELNAKYANKILHNVGLGIRVYDVLDASEETVHMVQDGSSQSKVTFRLVVYRPFKGEILTGRVAHNDPREGVRVSMDFFDDIIIPPAFMQPGTEFDEAEKLWVWRYEGSDLYMDIDEPVRFRVEVEQFVDVGPVRVGQVEAEGGAENEANKRPAPYSLLVSIAEPGLGLTAWWE
ncbi:DNA-directed RNA polymerase III subunit RPC8 [Geranomyces variabilis]|nr:DNA-directed RNA polymerase III subunit RPC8 [Geranomyces variabilis]